MPGRRAGSGQQMVQHYYKDDPLSYLGILFIYALNTEVEIGVGVGVGGWTSAMRSEPVIDFQERKSVRT